MKIADVLGCVQPRTSSPATPNAADQGRASPSRVLLHDDDHSPGSSDAAKSNNVAAQQNHWENLPEGRDARLIGLLEAQLLQGLPSVESLQVILDVALRLARSDHNVPPLLSLLPHVLGGMAKYGARSGPTESGLGFLANLAARPEGASELLRHGGMEHVLACMQGHADHAGIQRNAYRCLRNWSSAASEEAGELPDACVAFLTQQRVPQFACFMLHRHIGNAALQEQGLGAIWTFATSPRVGALLCEAAAADGVLRIMAAHADCEGVQRMACGVLAELLQSGLAPTAALWNAALAAARAHPASAAVQAEALGALLLLHSSPCAASAPANAAPPAQELLLEVLSVSAAALAAHIDSASTAQASCELLHAVLPPATCATAPHVHGAALEHLPHLFAALRAHPTDRPLVLASLALLRTLCAIERGLTAALSKAATVPAVLALAQRWEVEAGILADALHVLRCVTSIAPESTDEFLRANGLPVLLRAMSSQAASSPIGEPATLSMESSMEQACELGSEQAGGARLAVEILASGCSLLWSASLRQAAWHETLLNPSAAPLAPLLARLAADEMHASAPLQLGLHGLLWSLSLRPLWARALYADGWIVRLAAVEAATSASAEHASEAAPLRRFVRGSLSNLAACQGHASPDSSPRSPPPRRGRLAALVEHAERHPGEAEPMVIEAPTRSATPRALQLVLSGEDEAAEAMCSSDASCSEDEHQATGSAPRGLHS